MLGSRLDGVCKMMAGDFADTVLMVWAQTSDGQTPHKNARTPNGCRTTKQIAVAVERVVARLGVSNGRDSLREGILVLCLRVRKISLPLRVRSAHHPRHSSLSNRRQLALVPALLTPTSLQQIDLFLISIKKFESSTAQDELQPPHRTNDYDSHEQCALFKAKQLSTKPDCFRRGSE